MAENNTAGVQGNAGNTANTASAGTNTAGQAGAEHTFTQAEVDRLIEQRLAADRARQPNDDELRAYRDWKKTQKTEAEKQAERDAALTATQNELAQLKAISIHAPRVGSDNIAYLLVPEQHISIHAPRVGSDLVRLFRGGV